MGATKTIGPNEVWKDIERLSKEIREMSDRVFRAFAETDRQFQETRLQFQETDKRIEREWKKTNRAIGDLTGKWGQLVESLISPGALAVFQKRGIPVRQVFQHAKSTRGGENMEIDLLLQNGETIVAVEIKSTLGPDDVRDFAERLKSFKRFFPGFSEKKVLGAVSGLTFTCQSDRLAYKTGLFVLGHQGDNVKILNDSKFNPKAW